MAHITLVTGGCRSGKSGFALRLAEAMPGPRAYLATCQPGDEEMAERIARHRRQRDGSRWDTIEEPIHVARAVADAASYNVVLVDCLTLWISNLMHRAGLGAPEVNETWMSAHCEELVRACRQHPGAVILVTNEVGWGIVPESGVARRFRDLAGRCNQTLAAAADRVVLLCCGIPLVLKGEGQLACAAAAPGGKTGPDWSGQ